MQFDFVIVKGCVNDSRCLLVNSLLHVWRFIFMFRNNCLVPFVVSARLNCPIDIIYKITTCGKRSLCITRILRLFRSHSRRLIVRTTVFAASPADAHTRTAQHYWERKDADSDVDPVDFLDCFLHAQFCWFVAKLRTCKTSIVIYEKLLYS